MAKCQPILQEAKKLIEDTSNSRRELEGQVRKMQEELDEQRRKYEEAVRARSGDREKLDELLVQLSNLEAEINLLKRRLALLEEELGRLRKENSRLHVRPKWERKKQIINNLHRPNCNVSVPNWTRRH
jgi:chromosome segregation ATPase